MLLYDTHFHLDDSDNPGEIIGRAKENGVELLNLISCDIHDTQRNIAIAEEFGINTTAGVHPLHIDKFEDNYEEFMPFYENPKVVGVGEVGLDYFYHKEEELLERQRTIFRRFMEISAKTSKPAIIHCRDAFEDCYEIIKDTLKGEQAFIIHCYTGDYSWAEKFLELGAYISYSGIVTFNNATMLRESLKAVPQDRILIETDSPYLAPVPHRGKRNEPAFVSHVMERVAFELALPKEKLAEITVENGKRVFALS